MTAEYTLRNDGGIRVINSGRDIETAEIQQAEGRAYFVEDSKYRPSKSFFFGPFYGSYVIFEMDQKDYQYAFVAGNTTDYLWLLARTPQVSEGVLSRFKQRASSLGFDTSELIFLKHK